LVAAGGGGNFERLAGLGAGAATASVALAELLGDQLCRFEASRTREALRSRTRIFTCTGGACSLLGVAAVREETSSAMLLPASKLLLCDCRPLFDVAVVLSFSVSSLDMEAPRL